MQQGRLSSLIFLPPGALLSRPALLCPLSSGACVPPYLLYSPQEFLLLLLPLLPVSVQAVQKLHLLPLPVLLAVVDLPAQVHDEAMTVSKELLVLLPLLP